MMWRFESNGWPRDHLHAIDVPRDLLARDVDAVAQAGRTSSAENRDWLAAEVERVLARTGASRVVLVGNSRGGYAIRDYVRNAGGAAKVSHAILGGAPNRGVWSRPDFSPGSEFNGAGPFLTALNSPQGPGGEHVSARRALADAALGRARQVRAAHRRVDRAAEARDQRRCQGRRSRVR